MKQSGTIKKVSNKFLKEFDKKFPLDLKNYPSLEAQTASFADDIAYNNHDIDDGFRAGFFTIEDLCELDFVRKIIYDFDKQNPSADNGLRIYAVTRALIGAMVFDLLKTTKENISQNHIETTEDICKAKKFTAGFSEEMQSKIADLRTFLTKHFYTHSNIARMDAKSQKIVEDLFSAFMEDCRLLPMDLRQEIDFCSTIADKADKICTYIANMTDAFAVEEHQKMFNISYRF